MYLYYSIFLWNVLHKPNCKQALPKKSKVCQFCGTWPHLNLWMHLTQIDLRILDSVLQTHLHHKCKKHWWGKKNSEHTIQTVKPLNESTWQHAEHLVVSLHRLQILTGFSRLSGDRSIFAFQKRIVPFGTQTYWYMLTKNTNPLYLLAVQGTSQFPFKKSSWKSDM